MNILDIAIAKKLAGGGGGSGTDNYNDLSNLPKINDTTLSGNKTSANLGLQSEINSDSKLASDLVDDTNQDNKFVTSSEKSTWNGKQNAIDADHKINADYVDDSTSTNKFVTATDKETWNAKQNAIDSSHKLSSDLVDDTNHTNKFVTSTEKQTWNGKQNAIDSDHKLSSSLVSFTTAEAAALASGIDSTKVGQISTNQTNILYAINNGVKNLGNFGSTGYKSDSGITYKYEDNIITITGTKTTADCFQNLTAITLEKNTDYVLSGTRSGSPNISIYLYGVKNGSPVYIGDLGGEGSKTVNSGNNDSWFLRITIGGSVNDSVNSTFTNPMLSLKSVYDQSHDYQPPALPNYDLTYREQQDRNALVECVDNGTKNKLDFSSLEYADGHGAPTVTKTDTTITIASGNAWARAVYSGIHLKAGTYVLSVNITSATFVTGSVGTIRIVDNAWATGGVAYIEFNSIGKVSCIFTVDTEADLYFSFCPNYSGGDLSTANSFTATDVMICTKAAFDVSQKFVPYRPNWDLVGATVPAVTEMVNADNKNLIKVDLDCIVSANAGLTWNGNVGTTSDGHTTFTVNQTDGTIRVQSDGSNAQSQFMILTESTSPYYTVGERYVISGCPSGGSETTYDLRAWTTSNVYYIDRGAPYAFTCSVTRLKVDIVIRANKTLDVTFKPMICKEIDWNVSDKFVPAELIGGLKPIYRYDSKTVSKTFSYTIQREDFVTHGIVTHSCGTYIVSVINWSSAPSFSMYAISFSGGVTSYVNVTKIAGTDLTITVSESTFSFNTTGTVRIYALV